MLVQQRECREKEEETEKIKLNDKIIKKIELERVH